MKRTNNSTNTNTSPDIYQTITDKIVAAIEAGAGEWRMPWHTSAATSGDGTVRGANPVSVSTGKRYRGMNTVLLWITARSNGYDNPTWGTFQAWKERGASVRKGEKGTQIIFWKSITKTGIDADTGESTREEYLIAKPYYVFNIAQVDGYAAKPDAAPEPTIPLVGRIARADRFFDALKFDVRHGGNSAFCSRATGHIQLPHFDQFHSPQDYYSTRAHESVHRSGHPDRLDRVFGKRFGDETYAAEELVAELGAAFLCGHLELSNEPRPDHAQYLANWLRVLKNDKRAIFTAASKAQQAADYLIELAGSYEGNTDTDSDVGPAPAADAESIPVEPPLAPTTPIASPTIVDDGAILKVGAPGWVAGPVICKRSLKTGRKLNWRTFYGHRPHDSTKWHRSPDEIRDMEKRYRAWLAERASSMSGEAATRDALREREATMPLAAD